MTIKEILKVTGFRFNKTLGQNFISDVNLLRAITVDAGIDLNDTVIEIGTGAGTLTREIAAVAKKVYSFEIDRALQPVLELSLQGLENVEVIFRDVLKMSDSELREIITDGEFKVVANLPYYITTPLVMRFLESSLNIKNVTVMVQKEVADRFVAKENTPDYSAITLGIKMIGDAVITREVSRKMFFPEPNVDSAVVRIDIDRNKLQKEDYLMVRKLIRAAFCMRRKTLANNLSASFRIEKAEAERRIVKAGFPAMVRGEVLSLDDFVKLKQEFTD